jgi:tetratricopeptide (TPR) repeat protein
MRTSDYRIIEPTPYTCVAPGAPSHAWAQSPWLLAGVAGTIAFVVMALVLTRQSAPGTSRSGVTSSMVRTLAAAAPPAALDEIDPDPAASRKAAQAALKEALASLAPLAAADGDNWARSAMHKLRDRIAEGEKAYREERYRAAQRAYAAARADARKLEAEIPRMLEQWLDAGRLALANGQSAAADRAFARVLAVAPAHAAARAGRQRAATLDRVAALTAQADGFTALGDSAKAEAAYRDALALDSDAKAARAGLARLERAAREKELEQALSTGYAALAREDFATARRAFGRAQARSPSADEVLRAQTEVEHAATASLIARQLAAATQAVQREAWRDAVKHFDAALAADGELDSARDERARALTRAQLDALLASFAEDSRGLLEPPAQATAERALAEGRALQPRGPRLARQLTQVEAALARARQPLEITLLAAPDTAIELAGVGSLGYFATRSLILPPGRYQASAVGPDGASRSVEFVVEPGVQGQSIDLRSAN